MAEKIEGVKVLIYLNDEAIAESQSATLDLSTNMIPATSKSSGGFEQNLAGDRSWSLSDSGFREYGDASGNTRNLEDAWLNRTLVDVKFSTSESGDVGYSGQAHVSACNLVADHGAAATYAATITGTGPISKFTVT